MIVVLQPLHAYSTPPAKPLMNLLTGGMASPPITPTFLPSPDALTGPGVSSAAAAIAERTSAVRAPRPSRAGAAVRLPVASEQGAASRASAVDATAVRTVRGGCDRDATRGHDAHDGCSERMFSMLGAVRAATARERDAAANGRQRSASVTLYPPRPAVTETTAV